MLKTWASIGIEIPPGASGDVSTTCPQCSHLRKKRHVKCLRANVDNEMWRCWHCDFSGSLRSGTESRSNPNGWKPKVFVRPDYVVTPPTDPVIAWGAARGLTEETLAAFGVTSGESYFQDLEEWAPAVFFPYYRGEECINIKHRALMEKAFRQTTGAEKILFNLNATTGATEAWITEGEPDAMACWQAGVAAMSVPDGAPAKHAKPTDLKYEYLVTCHDELEPLTRITLVIDRDAPGEKLRNELARRLGVERIWTVVWPTDCAAVHGETPCKDANDVLVHHGAEVLYELLTHPVPWPIDDLVTLADLAETLVTAEPPPPRKSTGWANLDEIWGLSPTDTGRLILVTGWPSHGKSEWVDALILNTIQQHAWPWLICSPENMPVAEYVQRVIERETGREFYSTPPASRAEAIERLNPFVHLLTPEDMIPVEAVLKAARALVLRAGLRGILIDPWNEFDHSREKETSETEFTGMLLGKLRRFARLHGVQVVIVAHPTKLVRNKDGTWPRPSPRDVSGSAHWFNKPDDCIVVWRDTTIQTTKTEIELAKVRGKRMGTSGTVELYWDKQTGRYTQEFGGHPSL